MYWKEETSDVVIFPIDEFPWENNPHLDQNQFDSHLKKNSIVIFSKDCWNNVWKFGQGSDKEVGGLLIGNLWNKNSNYLYYICDFTFSEKMESSYFYLIMKQDLWSKANQIIEGTSLLIAGWFHTHPNMGAFYSQTDRKTQKNFFNFDYSLGLVFDPYREDYKIYISPESNLYSGEIYIMDLYI